MRHQHGAVRGQAAQVLVTIIECFEVNARLAIQMDVGLGNCVSGGHRPGAVVERYRELGSGLATRIEQVEQRVHVHESWQERQSRELLTAWLAESDEGAELWLGYEEAVEAAGSQWAALASAEGRAAIEAVVASIY